MGAPPLLGTSHSAVPLQVSENLYLIFGLISVLLCPNNQNKALLDRTSPILSLCRLDDVFMIAGIQADDGIMSCESVFHDQGSDRGMGVLCEEHVVSDAEPDQNVEGCPCLV